MKRLTLDIIFPLAATSAGVAYTAPVQPTLNNDDFLQITFGRTSPKGNSTYHIASNDDVLSPQNIAVNDWKRIGAVGHNGQALWFASATSSTAGPVSTKPSGTVTAPPGGGPNPNVAAAFTQRIDNLTIGNHDIISFDWAAVQQSGVTTGPATDRLTGSLGRQSKRADTLSIGTHGFSGCNIASLGLTATSASGLLSFMKCGAPVGLPPMELMRSVSMAVPKPPSSPCSALAYRVWAWSRPERDGAHSGTMQQMVMARSHKANASGSIDNAAPLCRVAVLCARRT